MSDPVEVKPKQSGGASKLLPAMVAVNSLLVVGVLVLVILRTGGAGAAAAKKGEHGAKPEEHAEKSEGGEHGGGEKKEGEKGAEIAAGGMGPTLKLPDFVVHLRNPEADRYARLSLEVEVGSEGDKASVLQHVPQIRDAYIAYLSDRTLEELRGSEGLEKTKGILKDKLKELNPTANIRALYVTDLVVQ